MWPLPTRRQWLKCKTITPVPIPTFNNWKSNQQFVDATTFSVAFWYLNWFDSELLRRSSSVQVQFQQSINFSPQINLVQIFQCSYIARAMLIQCSNSVRRNSLQDRKRSGLHGAYKYVNIMRTLDLSRLACWSKVVCMDANIFLLWVCRWAQIYPIPTNSKRRPQRTSFSLPEIKGGTCSQSAFLFHRGINRLRQKRGANEWDITNPKGCCLETLSNDYVIA